MEQGEERLERDGAGQGAGPWGSLVGVILEPGRTFAHLRERPALLAPYAVLTAASLLAGILMAGKTSEFAVRAMQASGQVSAEIAARMGKVVLISGMVGAALSPLLMGAIAAGVLALAGLFVGGQARFKQLMSLVGYAYLPVMVPGTLLKSLLIRGAPVEDVMLVSTSLAAFLPREQFGTWPYRVASLLDPFALWSLTLVVIGFAAVNRFPARKAAAVIVPLWLVVGVIGMWIGESRMPPMS